jgi:ligand-binding sensor domain-containing protein
LLNKNGIRIGNYRLENDEGGGDNNVLGLFTDSKGNIWAGTAGCGLFRYNQLKDRFDQILFNHQSNILDASSFVTSLLEDADGNYWIGTLNGLVLLNTTKGGDFECIDIPYSNEKGSISSNKIYVIFEDSHQRLWFGTSDNGLNLLNRQDNTFTIFQKKHGLPSNSIMGILEDDEGYLWITTHKGVSKFNPDSVSFTNYTREDGLNSNEFYLHSCLRTKKGQFYLGGENGFNVFYPKNIKKNSFIPPVYLTNLKISNVTSRRFGNAVDSL